MHRHCEPVLHPPFVGPCERRQTRRHAVQLARCKGRRCSLPALLLLLFALLASSPTHPHYCQLTSSEMARLARTEIALVAGLLALACTPAHAVIKCGPCQTQWYVGWGAGGPLGPICMCNNGSKAIFRWSGTSDHGVFQIPTDACPDNFTGFATSTYKSLAPSSPVGNYTWDVPTALGDYWITSPANNDCKDGILIQFRVISSSGRAAVQLGAAAAAVLAGVLLTLW